MANVLVDHDSVEPGASKSIGVKMAIQSPPKIEGKPTRLRRRANNFIDFHWAFEWIIRCRAHHLNNFTSYNFLLKTLF